MRVRVGRFIDVFNVCVQAGPVQAVADLTPTSLDLALRLPGVKFSVELGGR